MYTFKNKDAQFSYTVVSLQAGKAGAILLWGNQTVNAAM